MNCHSFLDTLSRHRTTQIDARTHAHTTRERVATPLYTRRALQLKQQLLGLMQKVRELMLHPIVGYNGRELTINFSFSRRNLGEKAKR